MRPFTETIVILSGAGGFVCESVCGVEGSLQPRLSPSADGGSRSQLEPLLEIQLESREQLV
jgi:hypothetical protein